MSLTKAYESYKFRNGNHCAKAVQGTLSICLRKYSSEIRISKKREALDAFILTF